MARSNQSRLNRFSRAALKRAQNKEKPSLSIGTSIINLFKYDLSVNIHFRNSYGGGSVTFNNQEHFVYNC